MQETVFWDFAPVSLVRTDVSEERIASIIGQVNRDETPAHYILIAIHLP
jgi:hypothetical protein